MIPLNIKSAIDGYVDHGYPVGDFVYAVLCNNLFEAIARADVESQFALPEICKYIFNLAPAPCWGSKKKVKDWIEVWKETPGLAERVASGDRQARKDYQ